MKLLKISIIVLSLLLIGACTTLEEEVYSNVFTSNFYKTANDAESALLACYSSLEGMDFIFFTPEMSGDHMWPRPVVNRQTLTLFSYDADYSALRSVGRLNESPVGFWLRMYAIINRANWVIAKVPDITMNEDRKKIIIAEAYLFRGWCHWQLARNFNEIPLRVTPSDNILGVTIAKSSKADVYKQIYSDFDKAAADLPSYSASLVKGRPSKEVALAFYAKAALYNEDWVNALQKAELVINSGKHGLMPTPKDVFNASIEDAARFENMWAFEGERTVRTGGQSQITAFYAPQGSNAPEYGAVTNGALYVYLDFFKSFSQTDLRRQQLLDTGYVGKDGKRVLMRNITPFSNQTAICKKYQDPGQTIQQASNSNFPFIRYADVLLIASEAEARQNGGTGKAYNYINLIRTRAGLPNLTTGLSKDDFVKAVLQERSWEFFGEGDRWYDLTRTNTFVDAVKKAVNPAFPDRSGVLPRHRYFPIPRTEEINTNPLIVQNPDWL